MPDDIQRLKDTLEDMARQAERPLYRQLESGFFHSPRMSVDERERRYQETCQDIMYQCMSLLRLSLFSENRTCKLCRDTTYCEAHSLCQYTGSDLV